MQTIPTALPGCVLVRQPVVRDDRGWFWKLAHADTFASLGLRSDFRESYCTASEPGVLRGMHFQTPPHDHAKLVACLSGQVIDVVLDLRKDSPTFGRFASFELVPDTGEAIYIPSGVAHGFVALEPSLLLYNVTSTHTPSHDHGVLWSSFGFTWPVGNPRLSARDLAHPRFDDFVSPFEFGRS